MIIVDTNILVYATFEDNEFFSQSMKIIEREDIVIPMIVYVESGAVNYHPASKRSHKKFQDSIEHKLDEALIDPPRKFLDRCKVWCFG